MGRFTLMAHLIRACFNRFLPAMAKMSRMRMNFYTFSEMTMLSFLLRIFACWFKILRAAPFLLWLGYLLKQITQNYSLRERDVYLRLSLTFRDPNSLFKIPRKSSSIWLSSCRELKLFRYQHSTMRSLQFFYKSLTLRVGLPSIHWKA